MKTRLRPRRVCNWLLNPSPSNHWALGLALSKECHFTSLGVKDRISCFLVISAPSCPSPHPQSKAGSETQPENPVLSTQLWHQFIAACFLYVDPPSLTCEVCTDLPSLPGAGRLKMGIFMQHQGDVKCCMGHKHACEQGADLVLATFQCIFVLCTQQCERKC